MGLLREMLEACGTTKEAIGTLNQGRTIAQCKGMDDKVMAAIYALGHQHYTSENYDKARKIMRYLSMHDHTNPEYLSALGACEYHLKNYPSAIGILEQAIILNREDPRPALNLALSLLKSGNKKKAKAAMQQAESLAKGKQEFALEWKLADRILAGGKNKPKQEQ